VLHHASKIDDLAIAVLAELPQPLRRALRDHGQRGDLASHQHRGGYSGDLEEVLDLEEE
jgi:hypothetical protein